MAIPVTVKCRIGVDEQDPETALDALADAVFAAGADALWVHARKAWLEGLSPKENRDIPPLDYGRVYRLKARLPNRIHRHQWRHSDRWMKPSGISATSTASCSAAPPTTRRACSPMPMPRFSATEPGETDWAGADRNHGRLLPPATSLRAGGWRRSRGI